MVAPKPERIVAALKQAANDIIMPRFRKLADTDVRSKGGNGNNLVTIADEECERLLSRILTDEIPGSHVVGEEAVASNPRSIEALGREDWIWIIDPIDGTANFVAGTSIFCAMVALLHRGETVMAWIHRPVDGDTLMSEKGAGAVLLDFAERTRSVKVPPLDSDDLSTMVAAIYNKDIAALKGKFARVSRSGCAGNDYWTATEGHLQAFAFRRLQPWDHAPGDLIFREAGGCVRMLSGARYEPSKPNQVGILGAQSEGVWRKIAGMARIAVAAV